jgi:hypothetical protein
MHLDAHALLTLLRLRRGKVFRGVLTCRERNYINELLDMRNYNAWWGNDGRGQARAWLAAGRRACDVDRGRETVTFARE